MPNKNGKTLLLLKPRGFCAGVVRAIDIVRIALEAFGPPIYVRKEIVHNRFVVEELQGKGAIFVDSVDEVPNGERVIYSAHGVSPEVREASRVRNLRVIDATCPLVTKVHVEAVKFAKEGYSLILIGHRDHDEVIGTLGEAPLVTQVVSSPEQAESLTVPDPTRSADLTQTTLALSRDDAGKFLPLYVERGVYAEDPFVSIDQQGVGALMRMAIEKGRATRKDLEIGICGEHGGEPRSVMYCHKIGLDYVSCSPYRVPIAKLSAAHAALKETVKVKEMGEK